MNCWICRPARSWSAKVSSVARFGSPYTRIVFVSFSFLAYVTSSGPGSNSSFISNSPSTAGTARISLHSGRVPGAHAGTASPCNSPARTYRTDFPGLASVKVSSCSDFSFEKVSGGRMLQRRVAGLLLCPTGDTHTWLDPGRVPIVLVDRPAPGLAADLVEIDDHRAAFDAVAHLIAHGHQRIAYVG